MDTCSRTESPYGLRLLIGMAGNATSPFPVRSRADRDRQFADRRRRDRHGDSELAGGAQLDRVALV